MTLFRPEALWLLLALPFALAGALVRYARSRALLSELGMGERIDRFSLRYWAEAAAFALFILFGAFAAADPAWGTDRLPERRSGLDVALAVDVSRSMLARDLPPSRLARARSELSSIIAANPGVAFSLVAFKGGAVELVPLTEDAEALAEALDVLDPGILSSTGTDLGAALRAALDSFAGGYATSRIVLLASDGEELSGDWRAAAQAAAEAGTRVFCIGLGSPEGSPVYLDGGEALRDARGKAVLSRLDEGALRGLAEATGGLYARARDQQAMGELARAVTEGAKARGGSSFRLVAVRRYGLFVALAILALLAGFATGFMRWEKR